MNDIIFKYNGEAFFLSMNPMSLEEFILKLNVQLHRGRGTRSEGKGCMRKLASVLVQIWAAVGEDICPTIRKGLMVLGVIYFLSIWNWF